MKYKIIGSIIVVVILIIVAIILGGGQPVDENGNPIPTEEQQ